jgi:hypothetical protein
MKLRSSSIDDSLNELDFVLSEKGTASARVILREAKREYYQFHQRLLRLLRAANTDAFDPCTPRRPRMHKRCK